MTLRGQHHKSIPNTQTDEPTALAEPPYLDRCRKMDFGRLRLFVDDSLRRLAQPGSDAALPRSKEEFLTLCDVLGVKADELKEGAPKQMPPRPVYQGPAKPGWWFEPSEELAGLYAKQRRCSRRYDDAIRDGSGKSYVEYVERELEEVEREVAPLETREKREYDLRLKDYQEAHGVHKRRVRLWEAEKEKYNRKRGDEAKRAELVRRTRREVESAFKPKSLKARPTGRIQWNPLPPGEATPSDVSRHYERLQREGRIEAFDQERLDKATSLPYSEWLVPTAGLEAYSIFKFSHTKKILLECPVYKNAAYVINSDEERWQRMSKQELIESGEAKKITHQGENWFPKVRKALDLP